MDKCIKYALKFKQGGYHKAGHTVGQSLGNATLYDSIEELEERRKGYVYFDELQEAEIAEVVMTSNVIRRDKD